MKLGIRGKLLVALFSILVVVIGISGFILSHNLKTNLVSSIEIELERHTQLVRMLASRTMQRPSIEIADELCDRSSEAIHTRVTLILADGTVIGDSDLSPEEIDRVESHKDRPEIVNALAKGRGRAIRYSTTVEHEMLYVAARFEAGQTVGVVRVSKPLAEVDVAENSLYSLLFIAGLVALCLALAMGAVTSHYFTRTLRGLVEYADRAVAGKRGPKPISGSDELGGLADSVQKLVDKLERGVDGLAGERDKFEAVLEEMSEAVLALDSNRRVIMINRAGIMLLRLGEQPIGRTLLETIRVSDLNILLNELAPGDQSKLEFDFSGSITRRVLASVSRRPSGDYVVVLQDITDLRRLEALRRDFVSNVSHELRTPVSIISANAETLLDGAIDDREAAERFLNSMVKNATRLTNLVSDLLDISRIEEDRLELDIKEITLALSLRRAAAALETRAIEKGISIQVESAADLKVRADAKALDQILFNLLDNAVKYTPPGGHISLKAMKYKGFIRIEVEDDGPGIDPRYRDRLFERFFRVDKGRSREMGGTGLGLAIAKHLVTAMGGEVGMIPAPNRGALFWTQLPT